MMIVSISVALGAFTAGACGGQAQGQDQSAFGAGAAGVDGGGTGSGGASAVCTTSLADGCRNGPQGLGGAPNWWGKCVYTWSLASDPSTWCSDALHYHLGSCGQYRAVVVSGDDNSTWFLYDPASGALVAALHDDPEGDTCVGGPSGFSLSLSSCTVLQNLCGDAG